MLLQTNLQDRTSLSKDIDGCVLITLLNHKTRLSDDLFALVNTFAELNYGVGLGTSDGLFKRKYRTILGVNNHFIIVYGVRLNIFIKLFSDGSIRLVKIHKTVIIIEHV